MTMPKYKIGQWLKHKDTAESLEFVGYRQNRLMCRRETGAVMSFSPREITRGRVIEVGERRRRKRERGARESRAKSRATDDLNLLFVDLDNFCNTPSATNLHGMKWRLTYHAHYHALTIKCCYTNEVLYRTKGRLICDAINSLFHKLNILTPR